MADEAFVDKGITTIYENYDVVVCGGGLAGFAAAVAAARQGCTTCLIHNRPVLGGCASSEVRVEPRGAACFHAYAREGGIAHEVMVEDRHRNHQDVFESGWANSVWDMGMYDMAMNTPLLTLKLNTTVLSAQVVEKHIESVRCHTPSEEKIVVVAGKRFVDCTGDGIVAMSAGCSWRRGEEPRSEFNEAHAPLEASDKTMGNSLLFKTVDMGKPVPFALPDWAVEFDDEKFFDEQGRFIYDTRGGFWWIELGSPWDVIGDGETIRHELTRRLLGVWDWMKNKDPRYIDKTKNLAIDWIGQVPGMRESRRFEGLYLLKENDLKENKVFPDEVAYAGWNIDLHTVGGMLANSSEPTALAGHDDKQGVAAAAYVGPFGVPLRSLIAQEVDNLAFAGRIISATHVALGSVRVMGTTAIIGQAAGTAAAVSLKEDVELRRIPEEAIDAVQQTLLRDDCFLPNVTNHDILDMARTARVEASSYEPYTGASRNEKWINGGVHVSDTERDNGALLHPTSQWIPVGRGNRATGISSLSAALSNNSTSEVSINMRLIAVDGIWDYRSDGAGVLASTRIRLAPGVHDVKWQLGMTSDTLDSQLSKFVGDSGYVRWEIGENAEVQWLPAGRVAPGAMAGFEMRSGGLHRLYNGITLNHHVDPQQNVYVPEQVISGIARPQHTVSEWRSAINSDLPAALGLSWKSPQKISEVRLAFPGNLAWEFDCYPSLFEDPQTPRDYDIQVSENNEWTTVCEIRGNYQSHRVHRFKNAVSTSEMRIVFKSTNGDPSAAVYEVRCY